MRQRMLALSEQMHLAVDVAIYLRKKGPCADPEAIINRQLIDLLLAVRDTGSVKTACEQLCCSTRNAQRLLKRFSDSSDIELLEYHGWQGTQLTEEGHQCINLYVAARQCMEQLAKAHALPRALPPLNQYPSFEDWNNLSV